MEILIDKSYGPVAQQAAHKKRKMDTDEEIIRHELVRVWTKVLEKYAKPGAYIPSVEEVRRELLEKGVNAAVKAVCEEHWFVFDWMVRDDIQRKVENGLNHFDLDWFIGEVHLAQNNPRLLNSLSKALRDHILFDKFG